MDVFALRTTDAGGRPLTAPEFHIATGKRPPWYQTDAKGKVKHYGVCPECKNPIHVINLDVDDRVDDAGRALPLYARHARNKVDGIAAYSTEAYACCSLANPQSLNGKSKTRPPGAGVDAILQALHEHADLVHYHVEQFLEVRLPDDAFKKLVQSFLKNEGQHYRAVSLWNLPFALLYMGESQPVFKFGAKDGTPFARAIQKTSSYQRYGETIVRTQGATAQLRFFVTDHRIPSDSAKPQTMQLVIEEESPPASGRKVPERTVLLKEDRPLELTRFRHSLGKRMRLQQIARDAVRASAGHFSTNPGT